jgi:hypothetical protein
MSQARPFIIPNLFLESFRGFKLSKNKVQWLDFPSSLWLTLWGLPLTNVVDNHYKIIFKKIKPCLHDSQKKCSWFMHYIGSDKRDPKSSQLPLSLHSKILRPLGFNFECYLCLIFEFYDIYHIELLVFICNLLGWLFFNHSHIFAYAIRQN